MRRQTIYNYPIISIGIFRKVAKYSTTILCSSSYFCPSLIVGWHLYMMHRSVKALNNTAHNDFVQLPNSTPQTLHVDSKWMWQN